MGSGGSVGLGWKPEKMVEAASALSRTYGDSVYPWSATYTWGGCGISALKESLQWLMIATIPFSPWATHSYLSLMTLSMASITNEIKWTLMESESAGQSRHVFHSDCGRLGKKLVWQHKYWGCFVWEVRSRWLVTRLWLFFDKNGRYECMFIKAERM